MNTFDYQKSNIGLPEAPLWLGIKAEELDYDEIKLLLISKEELQARILSFSYSEKYLTIEGAESGESKRFQLNEVMYLCFIKKYTFSLENIDLVFRGVGVELPSWNETYKIYLKNGLILDGEMKSCLIDSLGIHIFKNIENNLIRYFIPHTSVEKSKLGNKLGDELLSRNILKAKQVSKVLHEQKLYKNKRIGQYLVEQNIIKESDLEKVLNTQNFARRVKNKNMRIGDFLVKEKILTQNKLDEVLKTQKQKKGAKLGEILIDMGYVSDLEVHRVLANKLSLPLIRIDKFNVNPDVIELIPYEVAKQNSAFPLCLINDRLLVTFNDPLDNHAVDNIQALTNKVVEIAISTQADIYDALLTFYGGSVINDNFKQVEKLHFDSTYPDEQDRALIDIECGDSKQVVHLVDNILNDAIKKGASNIHVRPGRNAVDLLYRLEGCFVKQRTFHRSLLNMFVNRIKIIGEMDVSETRLPQDGLGVVINDNTYVDLILSVTPTIVGESIVIRLETRSKNLKLIDELGFNEEDSQIIVNFLHEERGVVLVVGPSQSGKTTTLYAALNEIVNDNLDIVTVENPVERYVSGIEQIQASSIPSYTVPRLLRRIISHNPDVIMLSELVDIETGALAFENAHADHLLLSSMDSNDALGAINKLLEMGVSSSLLGSSLLGIISQGLVSRSCENCLVVEDISLESRKFMSLDKNEEFFVGAGCASCNDTGFNGELVVYELLRITDKLKDLIANKAGINEIRQQAIQDGMVPLAMNVLQQARSKVISLKEAYEFTIKYDLK